MEAQYFKCLACTSMFPCAKETVFAFGPCQPLKASEQHYQDRCCLFTPLIIANHSDFHTLAEFVCFNFTSIAMAQLITRPPLLT